MNRNRFTLTMIILVLLAGALWLWSPKKTPQAPSPSIVAEQKAAPSIPGQQVVPPPRTTDKEELHKWWLKMTKLDERFEWKMPIEFYGKVIDDQNQPVPAATVSTHWTDLSATGSSERTLFTDAAGTFSLSGINGKRLIVRIEKDGYSIYNDNRSSFEYAAYFEIEWHVPDPTNPVIFRLRKNREAEPLVKREVRLPLRLGNATTFLLNPNDPGAAKVGIELLTNAQLRDKQWSARISVPGGGLQSTLDEFPYEAPESGYQSALLTDYATPKPIGVDGGYQGGVFFVQTPKGYGRIEIKMMPGNSYARINSFWNPSGSRNLEFDPSKVITQTQ